ncbi:MAG: hypothetical protein RLN81_09535 [Balneolaceae bacterium]
MMDIVHSIQLFVAINVFIIGLSHLLQPGIWIEFFEYLHSKGNVGNIFNAMISLGMGSIIFSFHFIWTWPMILVTLYGLLLTLKGLTYLVAPSIGLKSIGSINQNSKKFRWVGLIMTSFSLLLGLNLFYKFF